MLFSKNKNILLCATFLVYLMTLLVLAACTTKHNARSNAAYIIEAKTFNTNCIIHYTVFCDHEHTRSLHTVIRIYFSNQPNKQVKCLLQLLLSFIFLST